MQIGIDSLVETTLDPLKPRAHTEAERVRDLLEEIELAHQLGLDVFGIGEHHRKEFVASAPAVLLAAAATRTRQIRLTSAVTVLSSDDPVRVFQDSRRWPPAIATKLQGTFWKSFIGKKKSDRIRFRARTCVSGRPLVRLY